MKKITVAALSIAASLMLFGCGAKKQISITSAKDLEGKAVGCQAGTTGELYLQEEVKDAKVKSFKTGIDAAMALKNGAIDAIVIDELPALEIVRRNPTLTIVNDKFAEEEYAVAVRKGNTELLNSINTAISKAKSDNTYLTLINSFMPINGEIKIPEIPAIATDSTKLRMGTNAAFPPFEYIEGNDIVGFDASMGTLIANECNKQLEIVNMNFDSLIAALQSSAVDFVAAGMTATDERRKNVDFSEPYYTSNQVIIIRNN